jgi:hypothetical protein
MSTRRMTTTALGIAGISMVVVLWIMIPPVGLRQASANGQDEKAKPADEKQQDKGNADKQDEPERILARFMRQKLQASNLILEGLCTEDLDMVTDGTATLLKMSNEEQWRVHNDLMYRRYSREFVAAVEELQQEAKDMNMDGTSMAWVNVTMKCLKCHEWVRNPVLADRQDPQK